MVQGIFQKYFPGAFDWYLVAALPLAFGASAAVGAPALGTVLAYGQTGTPIATTVSRAMRLAKDAALAEQTGSEYQAVALYRQASRHLAMAFELVEWREAKPSPGAELLVPTKERLQHYTELYTQRAKQLETITELEAKALQPRPVSLSTPQDTEAVDAGLRLRELLRREPVAVPTENTLCDVPRLIVWMNEAKHAKVSSLVTPRGETARSVETKVNRTSVPGSS